MAIKINEYKQTNEKNIKQHKEKKKQFLFDFRIDGKRYRKIYKIANKKQHYTKDIQEVKRKLLAFKEEIRKRDISYVKAEQSHAVTDAPTDARGLFRRVYTSINELYASQPLIKAFFFFAFSGRSKDEISNLKWEHINVRTATYWIMQSRKHYPIPEMVKEVLFELYKDKSEGFVFRPSEEESCIEIPIEELKEYVGVDKLTLESMRSILVDALKEETNSSSAS